MSECSVQAMIAMDKHVKEMERFVKGALERFEAAGQKIDDEFINYFEDKTVDW